MKPVVIILALLLSSVLTQKVQRNFLDLEEIREMISDEVTSMADHDFFYPYSLFYVMCPEKILPALDVLYIDDNEAIFFCKMIENVLPGYFLPLLKISTTKNPKLMETLIREFFKSYASLHFDLDRIRVAKIFHKNVSVLFRLRRLFTYPPEILDIQLMNYLPEGQAIINVEKLDRVADQFVDLIVFRILEKTQNMLYTHPRLFYFTMFQMFEEPFNIVTYFLDDVSYMVNSFQVKYRNRRLYLMDSLENLALKSLNVFKATKTEENLKKNQPNTKAKEPLPPIGVNLYDASQFSEEVVDVNYPGGLLDNDIKENEIDVINYKLINLCVKNSAFKSQSLEKIYCYELASKINQDDYLIETPKYNELYGEVFYENSMQHTKELIDLEASYFMEETIFTDTIYPKFKAAIEIAAINFRRSVRILRKKFYDDAFMTVKKDFYYFWNRVLSYFWSVGLVSGGISPESLNTNLLNYFEFVDDNWTMRTTTEFFKLDAFYTAFMKKFDQNLLEFTRHK